MALAQAFSQDFMKRTPHEICCGRREEATLEFTHGYCGGTSVRDFDWSVFLVACNLALCIEGLVLSTNPLLN